MCRTEDTALGIKVFHSNTVDIPQCCAVGEIYSQWFCGKSLAREVEVIRPS